MAYIKSWPVWSERTGQSALAGATDPYDDALRILNYGPVAGDDSSIQNFPLSSGTGGQVYPVAINPLRTRAAGMDFSPFGFLPRRLNNAINSSADTTGGTTNDPYHVPYATALADQALDINCFNHGYRSWVRIGWNLLVSYFHFSTGGSDQAAWLARFGQSSAQRNTWFACKDGVVRNYPVQFDTAFMDDIETESGLVGSTWWTRDSGPGGFDFAFARFSGSVPPESEVAIARPLQGKVFDSFKRGDHEQGWAVDSQGRVLAASNSNTIVSGKTVDINSHNFGFYLDPVAIFDGDSGTPLFMHTHKGTVWICNLSSLAASGFNGLDDDRIEIINTVINLPAHVANHTDGDGSVRTITPYCGEVPSTPTKSSASGTIQLKRSGTPSNTPSSLAEGELAINYADGKLFYADGSGTIQEIVGGATSITPAADNGSGTAITTSGTITVLGGETMDATISGTTITVAHGTPTAPTPSISYTWPTGFDVDEFGHIVAVAASKTPLVPDQNLADIDDAAAARTNLGLVIGTDVAAESHVHDAADVTTGTFADARISESSVTQHADAIDLNDLGDVNIATGAGNDGDLVYFNNAGGAGDKFKGVARSSIGLSEFDNDLPAVQDSYLMLVESPSDKTYIIDGRCAAARTVTNFYAKTSTGTCTATLKNVTDTTTIGTISVTSTGGSAASLSNTAIDENDRISIEISSNSSSEDLELVVEYTQ